MRPLELSLEGFTSFRRPQTLNFSELDLFAIAGATGAGKSSLLDAITYALYGTTIRSGRQISELVSQGSQNLKVQLRFAVGSAQYRVTRRWRYRPKSPENKVLLEVWQHGDWDTLGTSSTAVQNSLEQILGMDFDTFTRAIVLPQGKFDEFLKGETSKRREILRQLAGFEIFERMRKEASDLAKLLKSERENVERQLAELSAPTAAEIEEQKSLLASLEAELPKLNAAVLTAQKTLTDEEQLFQQLANLRQLQQQLHQIELRSPEINAIAHQLERSLIANQLQGDWALLRDARKQCQTAQNAAATAQVRLKQAQTQLATQQQQLAAAQATRDLMAPQLKAREDALAAAKIYEEQRQQLQTEVAIAQSTRQAKQRQRQAAERDCKAAETKLQNASARVAAVTTLLAKHLPGGDRLAQLNRCATLFVEYQLVEQQVQEQQKQLKQVVQDERTAEDTYSVATLKLKQTEILLQEVRTALETATAANAEAAKLNHVAALRETLQAGDICPLCGGVHPERDRLPPLPTTETINLEPLRSRLAAATQKLQEAQRTTSKAEASVFSYQQQQRELKQQLTAVQGRLTEIQQQISQELNTSEWQVQALETERQTLTLSDAKYREAEQQLQQASGEHEKAQLALEFAQQTRAAAAIEAENASTECQRREQQLSEVVATLSQITGNQSYEQLAAALETEKQALATQVQAAETAERNAQNQAIQAQEADKQARENAAAALAKKEGLDAAWIAQLAAVNFTEETFVAATASAQKQSQWETAIREHREAKIQLTTRVNALQEAIGEKITDPAKIAQCRRDLETASETFQQANNRRAKLLAEIQIAEQNYEQAERLLSQHSTLAANEETYHLLSQNLKSNEFQAYILEHLEAQLVENATLILRELTDHRYALKIQEGEYWVEDNWNGGELRRVRTLSGGETFATSLSMALALSEKLSQGAQLGSLFLDEGFGTLDA
ncbi:MAG: AAA family ATPase, partial [Actinomycetota bacterium]